jgi:hypothetical protein
MNSAHDISPKDTHITPKSYECALAVTCYVIAIGSVCNAVLMSIAVCKFFQWFHLDEPIVRKVVIWMIFLAAMFFICGFVFWRMGLRHSRIARCEKQKAADVAQKKTD